MPTARPRIVAFSYGIDPWSTPFIEGAAGAAQMLDVDLLFFCPHVESRTFGSDSSLWPPVTFSGADAAINLIGSRFPFVRAALAARSIPRVNIFGDDPEASCVVADEQGALCQAVKHLADHGHRRIAYLSYQNPKPLIGTDTSIPARLQGYQAAIRENGLDSDPALIVPAIARPEDSQDATRPLVHMECTEQGRRGADYLLAQGVQFTAIIGWNDAMCLGAIEVLTAAGLRVPEDIAIVGVDNFRATRRTEPPLTTVSQPCYEIGFRTVQLAVGQLAHPGDPPRRQQVPMRLVRRVTCGCLPSRRCDYEAPDDQAADPVSELARAIFAKPQDINPEDYRELASHFAQRLGAGHGIVEVLAELLPTATTYGLDPSYCHTYLTMLRSRIAQLRQRHGSQTPPPAEFLQAARTLAAQQGPHYNQFNEQLFPQVQRLTRQLLRPLVKASDDRGIPEALRQVVLDCGGRFFSFAKATGDGSGNWHLWRWSVDRGAQIDHAVVGPFIAIEQFRPAFNGPAGVMIQELWSTWGERLGFLALDANSHLMTSYQEVAQSLTFVLEGMRTQQMLRSAKESADAASQAKSAFLSNMSHEIRSPMTSILGYADLLLEPGLSNEQRQSHIQTIRRNGRHLLNIINDILDLSKVEAGKMVVEKVDCALGQVISDLDSLLRVRAAEKSLTWSVELATPVPHRLKTDPTRLRQILLNLAGNAVKFTERGGVQMVLAVEQSPEARPVLTIRIIDTGIGMTAEQQQRLFQPFQQADVSTSRRFGGTGLGLAISRRLIGLLGGTLGVASAASQGSTFTVTLPLDASDLARQPLINDLAQLHSDSAAAQPRQSSVPRLRGRILLAEDGPDNRTLIGFLLRKTGAALDFAEDGAQAVAKARAAWRDGEPYDLILMDMQMPNMDGLEATRRLREMGYRQPIVALTANAMLEDRDRCLSAGCDGFVSKPVEPSRLYETMRDHIRSAAPAPAGV